MTEMTNRYLEMLDELARSRGMSRSSTSWSRRPPNARWSIPRTICGPERMAASALSSMVSSI